MYADPASGPGGRGGRGRRLQQNSKVATEIRCATMASRETSRTLGVRPLCSSSGGPSRSVVAEGHGEGPFEAVQAGAHGEACSAIDSTVLEGTMKRQRTNEQITDQHRAAPAGDYTAPQVTLSNGTAPP
eukprot:7378035-Prymnesium_polylepis.1